MAKKKTNQVPVAVIIAVIVTIVIVAIILASLYFTVPVVRDKIDTILGFKKVENTNSNPQFNFDKNFNKQNLRQETCDLFS